MSRDYHCHGVLNNLAKTIHAWGREKQFESHWFIVPEKLMLVVTELAEAMEAYRHLKDHVLKNLQYNYEMAMSDEDNKWVHNFREELADAIIRLLHMSDSLGIDIEHEVAAKMAKNELRAVKHGKQL